jgi:hypothetical protein
MRLMSRILLGWIGHTDLRAPRESEEHGAGPIAQALQVRAFDEAFLISDHEGAALDAYLRWLRKRSATRLHVLQEKLSGPTQFGEIYEAAVRACERAVSARRPDVSLTFHLSPGRGPSRGRRRVGVVISSKPTEAHSSSTKSASFPKPPK